MSIPDLGIWVKLEQVIGSLFKMSKKDNPDRWKLRKPCPCALTRMSVEEQKLQSHTDDYRPALHTAFDLGTSSGLGYV